MALIVFELFARSGVSHVVIRNRFQAGTYSRVTAYHLLALTSQFRLPMALALFLLLQLVVLMVLDVIFGVVSV